MLYYCLQVHGFQFCWTFGYWNMLGIGRVQLLNVLNANAVVPSLKANFHSWKAVLYCFQSWKPFCTALNCFMRCWDCFWCLIETIEAFLSLAQFLVLRHGNLQKPSRLCIGYPMHVVDIRMLI